MAPPGTVARKQFPCEQGSRLPAGSQLPEALSGGPLVPGDPAPGSAREPPPSFGPAPSLLAVMTDSSYRSQCPGGSKNQSHASRRPTFEELANDPTDRPRAGGAGLPYCLVPHQCLAVCLGWTHVHPFAGGGREDHPR